MKKQGTIVSCKTGYFVEGDPFIIKEEDGSISHLIFVKMEGGKVIYKYPHLDLKSENSNPEWIKKMRVLGVGALEAETNIFSLKYSQWEKAIKNGEVDSEKIVDFILIKQDRNGESLVEPYAKVIKLPKKIGTLIYREEKKPVKMETLLDLIFWLGDEYSLTILQFGYNQVQLKLSRIGNDPINPINFRESVLPKDHHLDMDTVIRCVKFMREELEKGESNESAS